MTAGQLVQVTNWQDVLPPDVYFTQAYHNLSATSEPDASGNVLLKWDSPDGRAYLPLILRRIGETDYFDATSAYGYGGPWTVGNPDFAHFKGELDEWAASSGVVSSFLRFHPLLENAQRVEEHIPVSLVGNTAVWDLTQTSELSEQMHKSHRKGWRRALRDGVVAEITEDPGAAVWRFKEVYETSMARLAATTFYWFPETYWQNLSSELSQQSVLIEATHENRVVAAVWGFHTKDYFHFHLSGTTDEGRRLGGALVCRVAAAQWAQERGIRYAHHGGGAGGADSSLLSWKRRFDEGTALREFYVAKLVHSKTKFQELAAESAETGFFPPWRATKQS